MKEKLENLFLYAGAGKRNYLKVKGNIEEANRKSLRSLSAVAILAVSIMLVLSAFFPILRSSQAAYAAVGCVSLALFLIANGPARKDHRFTYIGMYGFSMLLLCAGIALGTVVEPHQASASYAILLFAVPLFFTDIPVRSNAMILLSILLYMIAAVHTQDAEMLSFNESVVFPYGAISLIVCTIQMRAKVRSHVLEYTNRILSESDQLTGMLNRRCYELKLDELKSKGLPQGLKICALDINGLKRVNDNLGHHAGDELIRGAADCIEAVFGTYGSCYRVGGDEFMAVLEGNSPAPEELEHMLLTHTAAFTGTLVTGLSISAGIVEIQPEEQLSELLVRADKTMYRKKSEYYSRNGIDRRKS